MSRQKIGLPPGTLVYTGKKKIGPIKIKVMDYTGEELHELYISKIEDLKKYLHSDSVSWINVVGVHNTDVISRIGECLEIEPLTLEDVVNVHSRPKISFYDNYLFLQMKMIYDKHHVIFEQTSFILGKNFLLTFQEDDGDVFEPVRERVRTRKWALNKKGNDFLLYSLIDIIVDNYFGVVEKIGDRIDHLESEVFKNPDEGILHRIHLLRKELVMLRKSVWPLREMISHLQKSEQYVKRGTKMYLADLYDHVVQVVDSFETYRELSASVLESYLSTVSNRMNEVMKVLTVIATIFIPLTFVAGVYGMNFKNMPELYWHNGYYMILLVMLIAAMGMIIYFKKRKWM